MDDENHFVTLWILGLIAMVFFVFQGILNFDLAWTVGSVHPNFFFSMIAHGSMSHLLGNMFALGLFGLLLEGTIGSRKYVYVLLAAGVIGNLGGVFGGYNRVLGISGAIYGVFGALAVLRPKMIVWAAGMPMPMIVAALGWTFMDVVGAFAQASNTGHLAHLGGIVAGVIAGFLLRKQFPSQPRNPRARRLHKNEHIDHELDKWEERYMVA